MSENIEEINTLSAAAQAMVDRAMLDCTGIIRADEKEFMLLKELLDRGVIHSIRHVFILGYTADIKSGYCLAKNKQEYIQYHSHT